MKKTKLWFNLIAASATIIVIPVAVVACGATTSTSSTSTTNNTDLNTIAKNLEAGSYIAQVKDNTYFSPEQIYKDLNGKTIDLTNLASYIGTEITTQITKTLNGVSATYTLNTISSDNTTNGTLNLSISLTSSASSTPVIAKITITGLLTSAQVTARDKNTNALSVLSQTFQGLSPQGIINGVNINDAVVALNQMGFNNLTLNDFTKYINISFLESVQESINATLGGPSGKNPPLTNNLANGSYLIANVTAQNNNSGINIFLNFKLGTGAEQAIQNNVEISFTKVSTVNDKLNTVIKNLEAANFAAQISGTYSTPTEIFTALNGSTITLASLTPYIGTDVTSKITNLLDSVTATYTLNAISSDNTKDGTLNLTLNLSATDPVANATVQITIKGLLATNSTEIKASNNSKINTLAGALSTLPNPGIIKGTNISEAVAALNKEGFSNMTLSSLTKYIQIGYLNSLQSTINNMFGVANPVTNLPLTNSSTSNGLYLITNVTATSDGQGIDVTMKLELGFGAQQVVKNDVIIKFTPSLNVDLDTMVNNLKAAILGAQISGTYSTPDQVYSVLNSKTNLTLLDLVPYVGQDTINQINSLIIGANVTYTLAPITQDNTTNGTITLNLSLSTTNPAANATAQITIRGLLATNSTAIIENYNNRLRLLSGGLSRLPYPIINTGTNINEAVAYFTNIGFANLTLASFTKFIELKYLQGIQNTIIAVIPFEGDNTANPPSKNHGIGWSYSITNVEKSSDGLGINIFLSFKLGYGAQQVIKSGVQINLTPLQTS